MHVMPATRPPARAAAAVICLVAMVAGLAAGGTARAAGGPRVPASAVARLTELARRAAKVNGDPTPAWATAVLTTHAKALTSATPGDFTPGAHIPVYLVTVRGHFVAYQASIPPGGKAPSGRYLSLVINARTFFGMDFGISPKAPPVSPASLGPVTYLDVRGPAGPRRSPPGPDSQ